MTTISGHHQSNFSILASEETVDINSYLAAISTEWEIRGGGREGEGEKGSPSSLLIGDGASLTRHSCQSFVVTRREWRQINLWSGSCVVLRFTVPLAS